jgi:hypothetical protein
VPNLKSFAFGLYIESTRLSRRRRRRRRRRCARAAAAVGVGGGCVSARDPTTAAHVSVCGGGGSAPPPLQWASVAVVPPTSAARLCRRGPSLATQAAWPWLTDALWHCYILQNIKHPCNPVLVCCCISIAILQPSGAHNFI